MSTEATIFSDGSSRGNPGPGGWGAIIVFAPLTDVTPNTRVIELGGNESETTNNRMELTAALEALRVAHSLGVTKATVHTDSGYMVNSLTKWIHGWVKNDWLTKDEKQVLNRDLLECFYDLSSVIDVTWKQVPGHSGVAANERCDEIATGFADKSEVRLFDGSMSAYEVSLSLKAGAKKKKSKSSSKKAYSYISEVNGVIEVHKTWSECEKRVKGKKARFKKSVSKEDQDQIIKDFS